MNENSVVAIEETVIYEDWIDFYTVGRSGQTLKHEALYPVGAKTFSVR
jgi:hypothetical protein